MTEGSQDTSNPSADAGSGDGQKSIVSKNFSIVGDLNCQDILQIDGSVEGNIACQQLRVSEGGTIKGDIRADTVDMCGTLAGAIDARVLTLSKTSNVVGDIVVHESLGIEPGANFDGSCKKLGASVNAGKDDGAAEPAIAPAEPEASLPPALPPQEMTPEETANNAPAADTSMADEGTRSEETPEAPAPEPDAMEPGAKAEGQRIPGESMQSTLDKVAAELKATMNLAGAGKMAAATAGELAAPTAPAASPPAAVAQNAAPPNPDATINGSATAAAPTPTAAPAAPTAHAAAKAKPAATPAPAKPADGSNGAASAS